jgi:hypothetical protein
MHFGQVRGRSKSLAIPPTIKESLTEDDERQSPPPPVSLLKKTVSVSSSLNELPSQPGTSFRDYLTDYAEENLTREQDRFQSGVSSGGYSVSQRRKAQMDRIRQKYLRKTEVLKPREDDIPQVIQNALPLSAEIIQGSAPDA